VPKDSIDIAGHKREGGKPGDLGGAISGADLPQMSAAVEMTLDVEPAGAGLNKPISHD